MKMLNIKISIMLSLLFISILVNNSIINDQKSFASTGGLKIYVDLEHQNSGTVEVCVKSLSGKSECEEFRLDRFSSPAQLGPIEMEKGAIDDDEQFSVCVSDPNNPSISPICGSGVNGEEKEPEYVKLSMLDGTNQPPPSNPSQPISTQNQILIDKISQKIIEGNPSADYNSVKKILEDKAVQLQNNGEDANKFLSDLLQKVTIDNKSQVVKNIIAMSNS